MSKSRKLKTIIERIVERKLNKSKRLNESSDIYVYPKSSSWDVRNDLTDLFDDEDFPYYGEWDARTGAWIFNEDDDDAIDDMIQEIEDIVKDKTGHSVKIEVD